MDFDCSLFEFDILWKKEAPFYLALELLSFSFGDEASSIFCLYRDEDIFHFELFGIIIIRKEKGE